MQAGDAVREAAYPLGIIFMIGCLWTWAWSDALCANVNQTRWPAADPALSAKVLGENAYDAVQGKAGVSGSPISDNALTAISDDEND